MVLKLYCFNSSLSYFILECNETWQRILPDYQCAAVLWSGAPCGTRHASAAAWGGTRPPQSTAAGAVRRRGRGSQSQCDWCNAATRSFDRVCAVCPCSDSTGA